MRTRRRRMRGLNLRAKYSLRVGIGPEPLHCGYFIAMVGYLSATKWWHVGVSE